MKGFMIKFKSRTTQFMLAFPAINALVIDEQTGASTLYAEGMPPIPLPDAATTEDVAKQLAEHSNDGLRAFFERYLKALTGERDNNTTAGPTPPEPFDVIASIANPYAIDKPPAPPAAAETSSADTSTSAEPAASPATV